MCLGKKLKQFLATTKKAISILQIKAIFGFIITLKEELKFIVNPI
jgi:hypothetical protein